MRGGTEMVEMTKEERNKALMEEVIRYCVLRDMFDTINFYTNGHKYSSDPHPGSVKITIPIPEEELCRTGLDEMCDAPREATYYDCGEYNVCEYLEYCDPETVTMTFEGNFHSAYNGYFGNYRTEEAIVDIADKYGLYPEKGYSWSVAFVK